MSASVAPGLSAPTFVKSFVTVLVIMDPLGSIPVFLSLTSEMGARERDRAAAQAAALAGGVIFAFALFGRGILAVLGIGLPALETAGGLLLGLVALELLNPSGQQAGTAERNVALVPLGTPILAGPGAIVTTMYYIQSAHGIGGAATVVAALAAVIALTYVALRFAATAGKVLGTNGISVLTRLLGLLVAAIAVQLVAGGVAGLARRG